MPPWAATECARRGVSLMQRLVTLKPISPRVVAAPPPASPVPTTMTWNLRRLAGATRPQAGQRLIHVDVDPEVIGKNFPAEIAIVADAKITLNKLLEECEKQDPPAPRWTTSELEQIRAEARQELETLAPLQCQAIAQIEKALDDDAVVVSGVTNIGYWSHFAYHVKKPRTYLTSSYAATLGFAFPTALGAKMAAPERTVVSLSGDGGFMYALPELATAVQYGINVIALVFVDNAK